MLPFFGLASGYLTGKYRSAEDLAQSVRGGRMKDLVTTGAPMLAALDAVAAETGASLAAIALAWLRYQPSIPAPIASATSPAQLTQLIKGAQLELSPEQVAKLTFVVI